jgi:quinone-modifying oxidoreductase subunit QmoC
MTTTTPAIAIAPDHEFRAELLRRGGAGAARCFQCATCSSVCDLSTADAMFPRRQVLWAQWGLSDRLMADPAVWLCHQCNDCTARCPRDAKPGDTLQAVRALVIEELGTPRWLARLVGRAGSTWPLLVGVPVLFWALLVYAVTGFARPAGPLVYGDVVPHGLLYAVFFPAAGFASLTAWLGARRAWQAWGGGGSLLQGLAAVGKEILAHDRFGKCEQARPRKLGHLSLFWGFIGAAVTSGLIVVALYVLHEEMPLPQLHPFKILGNVSAALLVVGVGWLVANRLSGEGTAGASSAYDNFFLGLVVALVATGVCVEIGRYVFPAGLAVGLYVVHLGVVLTLFVTFAYSKFAHVLYRTLAMAHERLASQRRAP